MLHVTYKLEIFLKIICFNCNLFQLKSVFDSSIDLNGMSFMRFVTYFDDAYTDQMLLLVTY